MPGKDKGYTFENVISVCIMATSIRQGYKEQTLWLPKEIGDTAKRLAHERDLTMGELIATLLDDWALNPLTAPMATYKTKTNVVRAKGKRGRPRGKASHPDYSQYCTTLPENSWQRALIWKIQRLPKIDMSDLCTMLCYGWLQALEARDGQELAKALAERDD